VSAEAAQGPTGWPAARLPLDRQPPAAASSLASRLVPWYIDTMVHRDGASSSEEIERVQTGVRLEKRLLKVLKAVAELKDMTLGDLVEGIVLHAFEGKAPFSEHTLTQIEQFKKIYGLTLTASDSHQLKEKR
jgi:hypothetical protein